VLRGTAKTLTRVAAATLGALVAVGISGMAQAAPGDAHGTVTVEQGPKVYNLNGESDDPNDPERLATQRIDHIYITIGNKKVPVYCIDIDTPLGDNGDYKEGSWDDSGVPNLKAVRYVLTHSFPNTSGKSVFAAANATVPKPTPGDDEEKKRDTANYLTYVATQAVIWSLTDSDKFQMAPWVDGQSSEYNKAEYEAIYTVYRYLQTEAKRHANDESDPAPTLTIDPATKSGAVGEKIGPFTIKSGGGDATLTVTGGTIVDKDGKPVASLPNGGQFWVKATEAGSVKIHAEGSGKVPVGRVFLFAGGKDKYQKLIIGGVAGAKLTADATVTVTVAPASPSASPSAPPSLPITGANVTGAAIGGGALLIAGVALVLFLRRRRVKFTA
jgi:LPXTG-motif cell wall-anchored protein